MAGGSYPAQTITDAASKDTAGDAPDVVIRPAAGATVTVADLTLGGEIEGSNGPDHLTIQGISDDSFNSETATGIVRRRHLRHHVRRCETCNFTINHEQTAAQVNDVSDGLTIQNSNHGCLTISGWLMRNIKIDGSDGFVFENNFVHDYPGRVWTTTSSACSSPIRIGATIQDNLFETCDFYNIFLQPCNPANSGRCVLSNITIQNNWFDQPDAGVGNQLIRSTAIEGAAGNLLIRFNTFWNSGYSNLRSG